MRASLIIYFIFLSLWLGFVIFLGLIFASLSVSVGITFVVLVSLPMIIATITKFNLAVCVILAFLWIVIFGSLFLQNDTSAPAIDQVWLLAWVFLVPLFWLIPSIAGKERKGKEQVLRLDYPEYVMRKKK